jgi:hypothetical protein
MGVIGGGQLGRSTARNGLKGRGKKKIFVQLPTKCRDLYGIQSSLIYSPYITTGAYPKCKNQSPKLCDFLMISVSVVCDINLLMLKFLQVKSLTPDTNITTTPFRLSGIYFPIYPQLSSTPGNPLVCPQSEDASCLSDRDSLNMVNQI